MPRLFPWSYFSVVVPSTEITSRNPNLFPPPNWFFSPPPFPLFRSQGPHLPVPPQWHFCAFSPAGVAGGRFLFFSFLPHHFPEVLRILTAGPSPLFFPPSRFPSDNVRLPAHFFSLFNLLFFLFFPPPFFVSPGLIYTPRLFRKGASSVLYLPPLLPLPPFEPCLTVT